MHKSKYIFLTFLILLLTSCSKKKKELKTVSQIDSLNYKIVKFEKEDGNCSQFQKSCVTVKISYPFFLSDKFNFGADSANNYIHKEMFASISKGKNVTNLNDLTNIIIKERNNLIKKFSNYNIPWELIRNVKVIFNKNNILTLRIFKFSFLGGAHPDTYNIFYNLNISTGKKILLTELINLNSMKSLTKIAEKIFRKLKHIVPNAKLNNFHFWFKNDEFTLPNNFAITKTGLLFYYNPYEIAPYSEGPTNLLVPYSQIDSLINKKGLLAFFMK